MRKLFLLIICSMLFTACEAKAQTPENEFKIAASFITVAHFVEMIAGENADVISIMPVGQNIHDFEISPKQMVNLEDCDIIFYNGLGMEGFIEKLKESSSGDIEFTELASVLPHEMIIEAEEEHGDHEHESDPHIWLDPMILKKELELIKDTLIKYDSGNKNLYETNFAESVKKLNELDESYKAAVSEFKSKEILVSHEAYGYLCKAYGLDQIALTNIHASGDLSSKAMADMIDYIKSNGVKAIFYESSEPNNNIKTIAKETNIPMLRLNPVESQTDGENMDYFSIMYENLENLKKALL